MKKIDAYRTIGEVSEELEIEPHVLRFWEKRFSQIKPLKRSGGRRYYRKEDIDLLRKIKKLLYEEGLTIKGVQKNLNSSGVKVARKEGNMKIDKTFLRRLKSLKKNLTDIKSSLSRNL